MKEIYFAVNNELNYDQRMARICMSLAPHYNVSLIGKRYRSSLILVQQPFRQHRIYCRFKTGKLAYIEFNLKLFFFLLLKKADCLCAIDLDTILPVLAVSILRRCERLYDAHELFTEMKEVVTRPGIQKFWIWVERISVPRFRYGYTVSESIAQVFFKKYNLKLQVIRNMPELTARGNDERQNEKILLYQGAVNHGRCLEYLIPAMKQVQSKLIICGDGNFMDQSRQMVHEHKLDDKIIFKGMLLPKELYAITRSSYIGINLVEPEGLNQLYSLANKFFDYMHAALPQLSMDFVEYARINKNYKIALLIAEPDPNLIADALNLLLENDVLYDELKENCIKAREIFTWQKEEVALLGFYKKIFN